MPFPQSDATHSSSMRTFDEVRLHKFLDQSRHLLDEGEHSGRLHPDIVSGLAEIGFFDLMRPAYFGGMDADYHQVIRLIVEVSRYSGSLGWCLSLFSFHNMMSRRLPRSLQESLFSSKTTLIASALLPVGRAVAVGDGYILTGQWRYASGIHVANWVSVRVQVEGEGKPYEADLYVPAEKFHILDDWRAVGMRASGSNGIALSEVFVEKKFLVVPMEGEEFRRAALKDLPSYRLPHRVVVSLGTIAPAIGIIGSMLARPSNNPGSSRLSLEDFSQTQNALKLRARTDIAVNAFWKEVENALADAVTPEVMTVRRQMETMLRVALLMKTILELASEIFQQAGTKAMFSDHPLSRMMTDIQVLSTHFLCRVEVCAANLAVQPQ